MSFINIPIGSGEAKRERDDNEIMMESDEEIGKSEGEMGEEERDVIESLISSTLANQSDAFSSSSEAASSSTFSIPSNNSSLSKQSASNRKRQFSLEPIDSIHLSPASIAASSKISCLECRASKTRCSGGDICERCKRLNKECVYREHRRGRFSDSKRVQHLERVVQSLLGQIKSLQASQNEARKSSSFNSTKSSTKNVSSSSSLSISTAPALPDQQNDLWKLIDSRSSSPILDIRQNTFESLLSHPLRFMARFGKDVGLNDGIHENHPTSQTDYQDTVLNAQIGDYTPRITPSMSSTIDQSSIKPVRTSFLEGLRIVKLDRFDPIEMGIISLSKSEQLFRLYFDLLESSVTMFDVGLHSFEFVRTTSSFLLTTICFISSMFDMDSNSLTKRLEGHIYQKILPAILTQDYRSVEIVQAFVLLANYHPQITSLSQDRSWLFIGYASRIGWELGMNTSMQDAKLRFQNDIELIKRIRNRERTWLNVWITEMALCEFMGMAPMMRFDSIVISLGSWHLHPQSLPADHAIVALVQLRLILAKQAEMCEHFILQNHQTQQNDPNRLVEMMKITYKQSIERLNAWSNAWSQDPYASNISSQHPRFRRARICYWYARVMSASRILRFTFETRNSFSFDLYLDIYNACIAFLHQILHTQNGTAFQYSNNCSIILPTYCSIVCLSLIGIIQNSTSIDRSRLNMDVENTLVLITNVSETLNQAAAITPHRRGIANNYGPFLRAVLQKVKDKLQHESSTNKGKSSFPLRNPTVMHPSHPIASVFQGYDSRQYDIPAANGIFNEAAMTPQMNPMYWQQGHLGGSGIAQTMQTNLPINLNQTGPAGQQLPQQQRQQVESNSNYEMTFNSNELEGAQLYNLIFGPNDYSSVQQQQQQQQFPQNQKPS